MSFTTLTFHGRGGLDLTGYRWSPDQTPVAAIQIVHGMGEHALRYTPLAEQLAATGFVVYAYDHRGHGSSTTGELGELGQDGWAALVADIGSVGDQILARHPGNRLGSSPTAWVRLRHNSFC
jgi:alpha-beta hydrolase superfamily lysophospholipase|nr:alpha/beta hydrolase [Nocardia elegans]